MDISFDPAKNARNLEVHGISLERAIDFDWFGAFNVEDIRRDYGERRYKAVGLIGSRLHVLIHTPRAGKAHVISLRRANQREVREYAKKTAEQQKTSGTRES